MKLARILAAIVVSACAGASQAQQPDGQGGLQPEANQSQKESTRMQGPRGGGRPLVGKITAINGSTLTIEKINGDSVTVRISEKTEFRKDREAAKLSDFKVGDGVLVRGDEAADHTVDGQMILTRTAGFNRGPDGGPGRAQDGPGRGNFGTLGKDYVVGEVKAIDAPRLTVERVDNVTQVLELNEETSLRKGRDSITMADIQVGDHVMARGAAQNDVFIPKGLMVFSAEQWKRMEEMGFVGRVGQGETNQQKRGSNNPGPEPPPPPKPQEPNH